MQISDRSLAVTNSTLSNFIAELGQECSRVQTLINQLQLHHLTPHQRSEILGELLATAIHLHTNCDENFQTLVAEEMEQLPEHD